LNWYESFLYENPLQCRGNHSRTQPGVFVGNQTFSPILMITVFPIFTCEISKDILKVFQTQFKFHNVVQKVVHFQS